MKRNLFLGVCLAAFIAPTGVKAQYPQLTSEASQTYAKMKEELYRRSDEAWAKALPVVQKEAREGRPYIPWASRPYDLPQAKIPAFPGAEGGGMFTFGGRDHCRTDRSGRRSLHSRGVLLGEYARCHCASHAFPPRRDESTSP